MRGRDTVGERLQCERGRVTKQRGVPKKGKKELSNNNIMAKDCANSRAQQMRQPQKEGEGTRRLRDTSSRNSILERSLLLPFSDNDCSKRVKPLASVGLSS